MSSVDSFTGPRQVEGVLPLCRVSPTPHLYSHDIYRCSELSDSTTTVRQSLTFFYLVSHLHGATWPPCMMPRWRTSKAPAFLDWLDYIVAPGSCKEQGILSASTMVELFLRQYNYILAQFKNSVKFLFELIFTCKPPELLTPRGEQHKHLAVDDNLWRTSWNFSSVKSSWVLSPWRDQKGLWSNTSIKDYGTKKRHCLKSV